MEENNTTKNENNVSAETTKPVKEKNNSKNENKKSFSSLINEYKGEFRKINWPKREDLIKQTITVIIVSLIVGAIIFGMDFVFNIGFEKIVSILA